MYLVNKYYSINVNNNFQLTQSYNQFFSNIIMNRKISFEILFSFFRMKHRSKLSVIVFVLLFLVCFIIKWNWNNDENLHDFINLMKARKLRVQEVCNAKYYDKKYSNLEASRIFWIRNMGIAWCPVYKAAASTWRNHLSTVLNQTYGNVNLKKSSITRFVPQDPLLVQGAMHPTRNVWSKYVQELPILNNNLTGLLVVRHPFERLVSAYRDKLERNNLKEPFYYNTFGKYFVKRYREKAINTLGKEYFSEHNNFGTPLKVPNNRRPNAELPSFWEFSQAVIDGYKMDEHWEPIYKFCSVCHPANLKAFKYILKFEHLLTEENQFLKYHRWNISEKDMLKLNINRPETISSDQLTHLYFSSLSHEQLLGLYKVYELDFILFDYTFLYHDTMLPMVE